MRYFVTILRVMFLVLFIFLVANGKMMLWFGVFAVSLLAALFFGRIYCGYACPMNTLMIPTEWLSKKLHLQRGKIPKWLESGRFVWVAMILSIAVMIVLKKRLQINLPILLIWLAVSVIVTILYKPVVFHNYICPFGALQKIFGRFARLSANVVQEACIGCKLCEKACVTGAITVMDEGKTALINASICHQCAKCQQVCPKEAIHYAR